MNCAGPNEHADELSDNFRRQSQRNRQTQVANQTNLLTLNLSEFEAKLPVLLPADGRTTDTAYPIQTPIPDDAVHPSRTRNLNIPGQSIMTIPRPTVLKSGQASGSYRPQTLAQAAGRTECSLNDWQRP
jgi:hypothetical protein